ncbi:MAG: serine/threonine-protein phosphatase [Deltaproteobacteria bacterium]|nr:serine/threonine-protein phosphatase [Deltaproteobacteria bacterium]
MEIESFGTSDRGLVRETNEDNFMVDEQEGLFLVADGLGGLPKGDVASSRAIAIIQDFVARSRREDVHWPCAPCEGLSDEENRFLAAIQLANREIFTYFQGDVKNPIGMGTTLTGMLLDRDEVVIANVGDSRAYQIRDETLVQLTEDHSLVMEEVKKGHLPVEEARCHPQRHVLTQALGIAENISIDITTCPVRSGDLYLLCSDGLTDLVTDEEIRTLLLGGRNRALPSLGENLIGAAHEKGGLDNVTVVLVRLMAS